MSDTIQPTIESDIVFKYTTAFQAFKVGLFGIGMGLVMLLAYLKPDGAFPGLPSWASILFLIIIIFVLSAGLMAIFSARWVTVTVSKIPRQIIYVQRGLISTHQKFEMTKVVSVQLHKIWRQGYPVSVYYDHQLFIFLEDGIRIPLKNEETENPETVEVDVSLGTKVAQFMNVPFERTGPS